MKLLTPFLSSSCRAAIAALALCPLGLPAALHAAEPTNEVGVRLLEAELLPSKVTLLKVPCDPLVIAVGKTTLAHPRDAVAILDAALTRRVRKLRDPVATLPCSCARRIFLASVAAAPRRSSELLDLAVELYPDCTPEFAAALGDFEARRSSASDGDNATASPASAAMNSPMGTSFLNDPSNLGGGDGDGGFGVGFGPGFPGSPGFVGSGPGGGLALPPVAITAVVNG